MEHLYEEAVMWYVTAGGQRFVCPQFRVHASASKWDAYPDFVAVDFHAKTLYVIEVTIASNVSKIARRIASNGPETKKFLKENLKNDSVDFEDWAVKFRVFLRSTDACTRFSKLLKELFKKSDVSEVELDVKPLSIELVLKNWEWCDRAAVQPVNPLD